MSLINRVARRVYHELDHCLRIEYHKYKYINDGSCVKKIAQMIKKNSKQKVIASQIESRIKNIIVSATNSSVTVVFEYKIGPRHIKMIRGLKNAGVEVKVAVYTTVVEPDTYDEVLRLADECKIYHTTLELMYYIINFNSYIVHYCTAWGECDRAASLLCHKSLFPTIIVERYDVLSEMYSDHFGRYTKQNARMEKVCFELADAICAREYTLDFLKKEKGYQISAKDIVFLDYIGDA